jgi:hypothetical protein
MGETIIIEQEGPLSVHRDEYSRYYFCCTDCNAQIECEGGRRCRRGMSGQVTSSPSAEYEAPRKTRA